MQIPDEFHQPDYESGSIGNVPATVAEVLGASFQGLPPLREELWRPLSAGVERVVVLIIDAWGSNILAHEDAGVQGLLDRADVVGQLTSVFPSTTVAALSTLWTGAAPAQHGLVGLRVFLPDYAVATQMLSFTPTFGWYPGSLVDAGLDLETFLHSPGLAEQLAASGIATHALKGREIIDSALSKMHGRGVACDHGVSSLADMLVQMRHLLEDNVGERAYVCGYWPSIDTLSHVYGWNHDSILAESRAIVAQVESEFLNRLSSQARRNTVLFVVADHGQVVTPPNCHVFLEDHPELQQMLFMKPTGDTRTIYFHAKHGRQRDVVAYLHEHLKHALYAFSAEEALEGGLLGFAPHAPQTAERVGDVLATMRQGYTFLSEADRATANGKWGRHGGMTGDEMQVPWLGFRLDS